MARRRRQNPRVFFPWERRRGVLGALGRARLKLGLGVGALLVLALGLRSREEHAASVRATRASITNATRQVSSYRADHGGKCPDALAELVKQGYARDVPVDAWGRPLRLSCPGRRDTRGFDVSSDGPDGVLGGLDRVE
jgi:general secretion pathway protein G